MKTFIILFTSLLLAISSQAAPRCGDVLQNSDILANIASLAKLKISIEQSKVNGNTSLKSTAINNDYNNKERELIQILVEQRLMNVEQFRTHMKQSILKLQTLKEEQDKNAKEKRQIEKTIFDSTIDGSTMIFNPVEGGSILFQDEVGKRTVDVQDFDMMATVTTQLVWKEVVALMQEKIPSGFDFPPVPPQGIGEGDLHPVINISYNQIQDWINGLNKLSQMGEPILARLIPGHQQGDYYRLPTEAEWEFVVRNRGINNDDYFFGNDVSKLAHYAWYSQPILNVVALKDPLIFNNHRFYDMIGNVAQYTQSPLIGNPPFKPRRLGSVQSDFGIITRGGFWHASAERLKTFHRDVVYPNKGNPNTGFRLVREKR